MPLKNVSVSVCLSVSFAKYLWVAAVVFFLFFWCCLCAACAVKMFTTAHNSFARLPDSFCSTRRILGILQLEFIGLWVRAKELTDMQSHSDAARRNVSEIILTHIYTFCFLSQNLIFCCCCCAVKHTYECIFVTRPSLAYYIYWCKYWWHIGCTLYIAHEAWDMGYGLANKNRLKRAEWRDLSRLQSARERWKMLIKLLKCAKLTFMSKQLTLPPALATCNLDRLPRQNMYINKNIFMGCMLLRHCSKSNSNAATAAAATENVAKRLECLPNTKSRA